MNSTKDLVYVLETNKKPFTYRLVRTINFLRRYYFRSNKKSLQIVAQASTFLLVTIYNTLK